MGLYFATLAPGLTWANSGADGGDLIAAAATGGVAHPSGYPLYLLLARLFQLLPVGSLAFRTNLLSALAVTTAAVLVFQLVARSLPLLGGGMNWGAGLVSAYAFGLAPLVWSQAVITEVYGLHILLVVVILYLTSAPLPSFVTPLRLDLCLGLAFGLGLGNHLTTALLLPLLFSALPERRLAALLRRIAALGTGLLAYLSLPLRALQNPPVNWGNPVTWTGFRWLVSGEYYHNQFLGVTPAEVWERLRVTMGLLLDQAGLPGLIFAVLGLVFFFKRSALHRNSLWTMLVFLVFSLVYGTLDSFVYLMPVCLGFALWVGIGLAGGITSLPQRFSRLGPPVYLLLVLFLFFLAASHRSGVDASGDVRAETFGREVLSRAPQDAIIFAKGDKAVFAIWYFHFALHARADLVIVATDLLPFDWYQQNLHAAYPHLVLPGPFPFAERLAALNPDRPVCFIEYGKAAQIQCRPSYRDLEN